ncbi:unnamed protein product (macronuclear) [Paramecium tetraurelia]|uniref:CRAL-TRIO domain-containing protein n=1 Tax=Paramecium tetraurelia TaxID=5888 RepID=A0DSU8_PARTE|nr:uncharacterized protein GSPATT00019808001 [Paramecium tetraurelia]CAK86115.1 unnamed protein product [Paramecium tetraurelia]|eukprot:XP_001453512.1 hypothetical protein (macronuclear) [Paramecium tetraurelia strain d4-2]
MYLDISYLRPKSQQFLNKHSKFYIKSGTEGMIVRNIYEKVDYEEYEIKSIEDFKSKIQVSLPNSWKTSDYLKMLISADFSIQGALQVPQNKYLENLQIHLGWLNLYQNLEPNINQLKSGDFYIFGIDKQSRPVIIIKHLENENFLTFQYLLETVKRQVLIPYFVENWTIIYDCQNQEYNFYEIDNIKELMINFCGNLNNLLIVNSQLNFQQILNYIPNKTQIHSKIKLINNLDDLQQYILKEQLEEKYNGECSNVNNFWPPQIPQVSELLKHVTYDCYEDYQYGLRRLQDFKGRNLRKFSSLGRLSHQHSKTTSMKKSIESATSSSHLKILVHEENGNQLIQEEIEVLNGQGDSEFENVKKNDLNMYKTESVGLQQLEENNKQRQFQTILENENEIEQKCCSNKFNCMIF